MDFRRLAEQRTDDKLKDDVDARRVVRGTGQDGDEKVRKPFTLFTMKQAA